MEHRITFPTQGTCSSLIEVIGEGGRVKSAMFVGGCQGNTQGVARLVQGMTYDDVITRLSGIRCGSKTTSCPDQLAQAVSRLRELDK